MSNESFFQKVKDFFKRMIGKNKLLAEGKESQAKENISIIDDPVSFKKEKNMFEEASERNHYMELLKKYIRGEVKEENMTSEEISYLGKLLDEQIERTKRDNNSLKKNIIRKLLNNKSFMEVYNKFNNKEIREEELTKEQVMQIGFFYDVEIEKIKEEIRQLKAKIA